MPSKPKVFKVMESSHISVWDGDQECYAIIPSGFDDSKNEFIVIDTGPHFNGEVRHMSKEQISATFGIDVYHEQSVIKNNENNKTSYTGTDK